MPFRRRTEYVWHLRTRTLALGRRTAVMGILNVTPDSFSDGGHFYTPQHAPERALAQALRMLDGGAAILDLGGESTRPNALPLSPDEEQARVLPVIQSIRTERPSAILSIDTFHASTARHALAAGVEIVNDVSGHLWDERMAGTCAELGCGAVVMHTRGRPQQWQSLPALAPNEVVPNVLAGLRERIESASAAGIAQDRIILDPGFGFGKRLGENYPLLAGLEELRQFGLPVMVGLSRKSFLSNNVTSAPPLAADSASAADSATVGISAAAGDATTARSHATTAGNVAAILAGAHILRTHDVASAVAAAAVADEVLAVAQP
ncbi:MAG: dihydropteroate synthase [Acidobacteriota bacterium]|nr:dihydropteroate synthase [Acidobacteriota bacterium]